MPITHDVESIRPCCCGLWKIQQLAGFILGVGLSIIMTTVRPCQQYPQANDMLGITLLCGVFWVFEVVPIYITALLPLVLMPLFAITSSEIAAQAYWNMIQMLVVGTYLVDIALEEVHLPRRAALKLLLTTGVVQPGLLLFCFMTLCWVLSMFCNNIAVALMITPFAIGLMNAAEEQARDEAAAASEESEDHTDDSEMNVADASTADVQKFSNSLMLGIAYSTTAGGLATLTGTITNEVLYGVGNITQEISYYKWLEFAFPVSLATFLLSYAVLYVRYVHGLKLRHMTQEVLEAEYEELVKEIGPFSRDELLVGSIQVLQFTLLFLRPYIAKMSIFTTSYGDPLIGDPTLAVLPAVLLFFIPSAVRPGQALLTWPAVHDKFDFGLLMLIGGGFAISSGFTQSGLNLALGQGIATMTEQVHPFTLNLVIVLVVSCATQIFSAVGTATTALPAFYSAALNAVHNPMAFVLPATVACSFSFMLPTATPANVIVLAKSQDLSRPLRIRDFFCTGLPLNLLVAVVGAVICFCMSRDIFDAGAPFPKWACDGVNCMWVPVSGYVGDDIHVGSQACMLDLDEANITTCTLWNRTSIDVTPYLADVTL